MLRERPLKIGPRQRRSPTVAIILLLAAILLITLDRAGMLGDLRARATSLVAPALGLAHRAGTAADDLAGQLRDTTSAEQRLAALQEENGRLRAENLRVAELELEISRLRQQLRIEEERPWQLLGADVSAFGPDSGRRQILLAIGSDQGVRPGMAVIAREGSNPPALIGVVEQVGPASASVLLITDFSSSVSARIYRTDRTIDAVLQGQWQRGSRLQLEEISRDEVLAVGDAVVTAGLSATMGADLLRAAIPANIPIGTVTQVTSAGHTQQADIQPFVDPDRVRYAWVILSADG